MKRISLALIFFTLTVAAHAGPYDQVYSIVTAEFIKSADWHIKPVILNRVDDQSTTFDREAVTPGKHLVVADLPASRAHHQRLATQRTLELDMQPCTRYYIAARLENEVTRKWELIVNRTEAMGDCEVKYLKTAAK